MLRHRVVLLLLVLRFLPHVKAGAHYSRLNARLHAAAVARAYDSEDTWQSPPSNNNWIILQRADAASAAAAATSNSNRRSHTPHSSGGFLQMSWPHTHQHTQMQAYTQKPPQRLPASYFAYNNSGGNYSPLQKDKGTLKPYVLAVSKMRPEEGDSAEQPLTRRRFAASLGSGKELPPEESRHNKIQNKWHNHNEEEEEDEDDDAERNVISQRQAEVRQEIEAGESDEDVSDADRQQLNELLLPLQNALDKVIQFCDVTKRLLIDNEVTDENDQSNNAAAASTPSAFSSASPSSPVVSGEVQGRTKSSSISSAPSLLSSLGTGRKLKKKLKKLMLPLLIAYKLKFLTLVPVLIGGLTLLVGTTGLAGFFFALFAAVMSLKSGGGKSIEVKKI